MATEVVWNDQMGSRSRAAWCLLVKAGEIRRFTGENIPGWAVVRHSQFKKNGKWSHTVWTLVLAEGVKSICGKNGWDDNTFEEGLQSAIKLPQPITSWAELAGAIELSVPATRAFLVAWNCRASMLAVHTLDTREKALAELGAA